MPKRATGALVLLFSLAATQTQAADLTKADNATDLGTAGSYTSAAAVPTAGDILIFDGTLVANSTFSWTTNRSVQGVRVLNPTGDITVNLSGASFDWTASDGTVIDLSSATRNLTFATTSSVAALRVRGTTSGGATLSVASGRTIRIQSNLFYNNVSNGTTSVIHVSGAGNFTVDGSNGRISDKAAGSSTLTGFSHEGTGTVTLAGANTYSGGTSLSGGTLLVGASKALGEGAVNVGGGTLDLNGTDIVNLTLAANKDFTFSGGTLAFNIGTGLDQISGGGSGKFNLTGGSIALTLGAGFDYGVTYQLFAGFAGTSVVSGVTFSGFDSANYQAMLNNLGQLSFSAGAVPEPSACAALLGGAALAGAAAWSRRRGSRGRTVPPRA